MKRSITALLMIVLSAALLTGCAGRASAALSGSFETSPAEIGDLSANVVATGTLRANRSQTLFWQVSGTVETVSAALLDTVKAGQSLASLQPGSLPQNVLLAQSDLLDAQRALDSLTSSRTETAQTQLNLVEAQKAFEDAQRKRANLDRGRASQETIDTARADLVLAQAAVDQAQGIYNNMSGLSEDDPARANALSALANAKKIRDRAKANLNWYLGTAGEDEIAEADANLALAQARLADAEREWQRVENGPSAAQIAAAEARVTAIQATLDSAGLTAPFDGLVTSSTPLPGSPVSAGDPAFTIEDRSRLLIDTQISEIDINRLQAGQPVEVTFDAIYGQIYTGKVSQVGVSGSRDSSGVVTFPVTIELLDADESVRTGMTAAVSIQVEAVKDVLLVPNRAIRVLEGQRVVYVLRGEDPQPQPVEISLGVSSETQSQVLSGELQAGDIIVLNPPTESLMGQMRIGGQP